MKELINLLLSGPDSQLDANMRLLINKWSDPPEPIQVLEVLDYCIHCGLASGLVVQVLQAIYDNILKNNFITHEEVVKLATWRKEVGDDNRFRLRF